jgi:hypothetical protein
MTDTPTPDLVERLRVKVHGGYPDADAIAAADEIERLQARCKRWENAAFRMTGMSSIRERNAEYLAAATEEPTDD